jgi:hypothetical protein
MAKHYSRLKAEIRQRWRQHYKEQMQREGKRLPPGFQESEPTDGDLFPPDAERVARRAGCLAAVALRGLAATWELEQQTEFLPQLLEWIESSPLIFEMEQEEMDVVKTPAGTLDERSMVNACWRWEGAAALVASLGRLSLPAHDSVVETKSCGDAAGLFLPYKELSDHIENAVFDPAFDRFAYANKALSIHWRLRQFVHAEQKPIDFADFAKGVTWAQFNLTGVPLAKGDLAIHGVPISEATSEMVSGTMSIAAERHTAANWLIGWSELYSEVDNPT